MRFFTGGFRSVHPVISISIFTILQAVVVILTLAALQKAQLPPLIHIGFRRIFIPVVVSLAILPVLGTLLPDSSIKFILQGAGNIFLAFFAYYAMSMIASILILAILSVFFKGVPRNLYRVILLICVILPLVVVPYGLIHAQNFRTSRYEAQVERQDQKDQQDELKLILIADLHLSVNTYYKTIERMVQAINAEQADAVLIAGDIFTSSYESLKDPDLYAALLASIESRYGTFAVCGNHDVEEGLFGGFPVTPISKAFRIHQMDEFFRACHFRMLYDEIVDLDGRLQIAGRIDGEKAGDGTTNRADAAQLLSNADPDIPILVLEHEPFEFAELKENGADLAMCGHTHAGQFFPGTITTQLFFDNVWGYKKVAGLDTYVTSGIGYYGPPIRVGCDSEIMVVDLHIN